MPATPQPLSDRQEKQLEQEWLGRPLRTSSKVVCTDGSKPASALPPPGPQCRQIEFAKWGTPIMSPSPYMRGVTMGISSPVGMPTHIYVWLDNQTNEDQTYYMCCGSSAFSAIDVFDSMGDRLLGKWEQATRRWCKEGRTLISACTCSANIIVAPHTMQIVDSGDLETQYELPPGQYFIALSTLHREDCESFAKERERAASASPTNAIMVMIPQR